MPNSKKPRPPEPTPKNSVDLRELERLLDFMGSHGLEELEYGREGFHVRLKKGSTGSSGGRSHSSHTFAEAPGRAAEIQRERPAAAAAPEAPAEPQNDGLHVVKSPIVGTYYASPNPESPVFVSVGDQVKTKQVLCIIEAMKLMNEIESDIDGEIAKVFVENGQPVEYGEALFGIRPHSKK
jgi:acetyl-CoA carboxylase biotin carboxyl carrier protein